MWSVITDGVTCNSKHNDPRAAKCTGHCAPPTEDGTPEEAESQGCNCSAPAYYTLDQARVTFHRAFATVLASTGLTRREAATAAGVGKLKVDIWCGDYAGLSDTVPIDRLLVLAQTSKQGREVAIAMATVLLSQLQIDVDAEGGE